MRQRAVLTLPSRYVMPSTVYRPSSSSSFSGSFTSSSSCRINNKLSSYRSTYGTVYCVCMMLFAVLPSCNLQ